MGLHPEGAVPKAHALSRAQGLAHALFGQHGVQDFADDQALVFVEVFKVLKKLGGAGHGGRAVGEIVQADSWREAPASVSLRKACLQRLIFYRRAKEALRWRTTRI